VVEGTLGIDDEHAVDHRGRVRGTGGDEGAGELPLARAPCRVALGEVGEQNLGPRQPGGQPAGDAVEDLDVVLVPEHSEAAALEALLQAHDRLDVGMRVTEEDVEDLVAAARFWPHRRPHHRAQMVRPDPVGVARRNRYTPVTSWPFSAREARARVGREAERRRKGNLMAETNEDLLERDLRHGPVTVSSDPGPLALTIDGRVAQVRADRSLDEGSCNPPWSSWDS
jgi:hypothetical protein